MELIVASLGLTGVIAGCFSYLKEGQPILLTVFFVFCNALMMFMNLQRAFKKEVKK